MTKPSPALLHCLVLLLLTDVLNSFCSTSEDKWSILTQGEHCSGRQAGHRAVHPPTPHRVSAAAPPSLPHVTHAAPSVETTPAERYAKIDVF